MTYAYFPSGENVNPFEMLDYCKKVRHGLNWQIHTIWMRKAIGSDSDGACVRVEPVNLVLETRGRAEVLIIAIRNIGEVDLRIIWVNGHII